METADAFAAEGLAAEAAGALAAGRLAAEAVVFAGGIGNGSAIMSRCWSISGSSPVAIRKVVGKKYLVAAVIALGNPSSASMPSPRKWV